MFCRVVPKIEKPGTLLMTYAPVLQISLIKNDNLT